ncbi:DCC1-like thiol-disulfide oxidoreductase family protein [Bdellovibrio sp. 22V]|uniref:thiol-disulfide oxidoreductase DCC family protein n=1 Tax=Bdellovibrio TaxID=958 RepID=UPI002542D33D|nr:DCC1-like thiol-disulfide oxidoreductase family protein [Bdellovibrio sp. 22V]WII71584.1 DCC1-like thiol-disulfide oxidoreductase family protein [Bdellovibrio sp. 22V]
MRNVVFFDGVCHLCNGFVDAVISRDKAHLLLFAPLQGTTAEDVLPQEDRVKLDTVIYFEAGKIYYRSAAILKILTSLGGVYKLFSIAWIIPAPLRDFLYRIIAKNRYAWFGQREFCRLPTPEERSYLLP